MANANWVQMLLRIPIIFLLDYSFSFMYDYLTNLMPWYCALMTQGFWVICLVIVLHSTNSQLFTMYYFGVFLFHLTVVLYVNIWKSPFVTENEMSFIELLNPYSSYFPLQPLLVSWFIYSISIILYALSFRSIKPVLMVAALIPLYARHINKNHRDASFFESAAFGVAIFIILQTCYKMTIQLKELVEHQIRMNLFRYRMYGSLVLFYLQWRRLQLNFVLSIYWFIIWNYQMIVFTIFVEEQFHASFILACASYACNSFIKIVSLCYVVQHAVKILLNVVQQFVKDDHTMIDEGQYRPSGLRESVGFLVLSLYTNLTSMNASKRIVFFELIMLLLVSGIIRSIFEVIEPYLLSLNGAITYSKKRHFQLVTFCLTLLVAAAYMGTYLYRLRGKLPFSIPNVITVAQITCGLLLYLMYMYDSYQGGTWEHLDDCVYYIKGTCRTFEFILIVIVLGYRVLDTSSKWTVFQVVMVVLHLYVNVYLSLKDGWRSVRLRRKVNQKLNILPQASTERLAETRDVCPICLEELKSARVTPCNHLFHMFCLKKWLNVQNKCPMCHATILETDS
ncbi:RING finger protein 145-like [Clytia hemisphaerica]|uniref:RING-type domain-containing protein n=1 Tax=Clytia hemisphaerica TaxID=252671 RepID=A0A7M5X7I5_9CNID|eukprot:TCONS_00012775-protein